MSSNGATVVRAERWSVDNDDTNEFWGMFNSRERAEKECDRANDGHQVGKFVVRHLREVPPPSPAVAEGTRMAVESAIDASKRPGTWAAHAAPESVPTAEEVAKEFAEEVWRHLIGINSGEKARVARLELVKAATALITADRDRLARRVAELEGERDRACQTIAAMHAAAVGEVRGPIRGVVEDIADLRAKVENLEIDKQQQVEELHGLYAKLAAAGGGVDKEPFPMLRINFVELGGVQFVWCACGPKEVYISFPFDIAEKVVARHAALRQSGGGE